MRNLTKKMEICIRFGNILAGFIHMPLICFISVFLTNQIFLNHKVIRHEGKLGQGFLHLLAMSSKLQ